MERVKPGATTIHILEQIIEDAASGLTLQFEHLEDGESTIRIFGDLPFGNRTLSFNAQGECSGAGTSLHNCVRPTWLHSVKG